MEDLSKAVVPYVHHVTPFEYISSVFGESMATIIVASFMGVLVTTMIWMFDYILNTVYRRRQEELEETEEENPIEELRKENQRLRQDIFNTKVQYIAESMKDCDEKTKRNSNDKIRNLMVQYGPDLDFEEALDILDGLDN